MFDEVAALRRQVEALEAMSKRQEQRIWMLFNTICIAFTANGTDFRRVLADLDSAYGKAGIPNEFADELRTVIRDAEQRGY